MALNKTLFVDAIKDVIKVDDKTAQQKAEALADAIDNYIKSADVVIPSKTVNTTGTAEAQSGTIASFTVKLS
jgi:hypothetical protein